MSGTDRRTSPLYDKLDAIVGTSAVSTPSALLESNSTATEADGKAYL